MPAITVRLRYDCYGPTDTAESAFISGYDETIDTDTLSPRAASLAEAIATCGRGNLNIALETSGPYVPPPVPPDVAAAYGNSLPRHLHPADGERVRRAVQIPRMRADSHRTAAEFLESQARELSRGDGGADWYPLGATVATGMPSLAEGVTPSPSAVAAREDRHLMREEVLDRMRAAGQPMDVQAWDTLRKAGHLPAPDRHVAGRIPQWRPDTIDAYLGRDRETWPLSRVAEYLGYGGTPATAAGSARKQLHRWGITASGRAAGRGGESLYDADQVMAAAGARPGSGWRRGQMGGR